MTINLIDKNNLIWFWQTEETLFNVWDLNIQTDKEKILTYYKNSFHIKEKKKIWDKMMVFLHFSREEINYNKININWFLNWLSIYQEYDEKNNIFNSYIYEFPKQEIDDLNDIIFTLIEENNFLILEWNIVKINWIFNNQDNIFWNIENALKNNDLWFLISFLFWLTFAYWKFDLKNDSLLWAKIHIPLVWNLINKQENFDKIINFFAQNWVFLKSDILDKKIGYTYQISINDWEVLQNFSTFLTPIIWENKNIKYQKIEEFKENISNYIEKIWNFDNIYIQSWILKYLEK